MTASPPPTPYTWSSQEVPSAALLNANVRDAQNWLLQGIPMYHGDKTLAQTIPNNSWTAVTLFADTVNRGFTHSDGSAYVVVDQAGWYRLVGSLRLGCTTTGAIGGRGLGFQKNASTWITNVAILGSGNVVASHAFLNRTASVYLAAGDFVSMMAFQTGGSATDCKTYGATGYTHLSIVWQGRDAT